MAGIREIKENKKRYLKLLLLADEQESMVDRYLDRGTMYVLEENGETKARAVCVVTDEGNGVLEIKNLAVAEAFQKHGYGKRMIRFVEENYRADFKVLRVGTGDSPLTLPFYEHCGFLEQYRIKDFFTENYDHPIFECGKQLTDMIYLEKQLQRETGNPSEQGE